MRIPSSPFFAGGVALTALCGIVCAQTVPPPGAVSDAQQFPAIRGVLERVTLTARGDVDGLLLTDGTEVKTSADLSTQIAVAFKPGDRLTVHGLKAAALPLVRAVSITDEVTHQTVTDSSIARNPPPPRPAPPALGASTETSGRVLMALHGPQGEMNGVLLDSGTILRFAPDQAAQVTSLLQPRASLIAEGISVSSALGTVVDVQQVGPSRDRLVAVGAPARPLSDPRAAGPGRRPPLDGGPRADLPPPPRGSAPPPDSPPSAPAGPAPGPGAAPPAG